MSTIAALHFAGGVACAQNDISAVGIRQIEFKDGQRRLALTMFYPARHETTAKPFVMPFYSNVNVLQNARPDFGDSRRPLVMFSHGRGSNALSYAWFGEYLAGRGYIVAAIDHHRTNTYDANIAYLANKLWQRPVDIGLAISFLLHSKLWRPAIDPDRIAAAGHSQGGFTTLWLGGAQVNADKYLEFQKRWRNNTMVPAHLRDQLPLDATPALKVRDRRIKAAFAMAPGVLQAFGMDEAGLRQVSVPTFLIVGARDTQTKPGPNAEFAARHIPRAELVVMPGLVDHEIFVNECNQEGRDEFPEACIDAPGVDRAAMHKSIGEAAIRFFEAALDRSNSR
jgi:predicted dienelactone hydrolase